jgi:hypothetical protein
LCLPRKAKKFLLKNLECSNLDEALDKVLAFSNKELKNYNRNLTPFLYCGEKTGSLKLLYDGTLVNC